MAINKQKEEARQARVQDLHRKEEEELMRMLSEKYEVPYVDLSTISINGNALRLVPEKEAREVEVAPFALTGKRVKMAVRSPQKTAVEKIIDDLEREGYEVEMFMVSEESLKKAWELYKELSYATEAKGGVFDISGDTLGKTTKESVDLSAVQQTIKGSIGKTKQYKTSRILEAILGGAIGVDASDVHIEVVEAGARLRYRLDGVLHDVLPVSEEVYKLILSRIKLLSGLKLNVTESAQDGRFSIALKDTNIEIRTSVLPGEYGESIVMRLLNPKTISISFEELGVNMSLFDILKREIKRPNGMILTTGPTGSGKTTTLYAVLREIYTPEIKIITIEDPVEYHMEGITQTQVNKKKGYSFLTGLRSALRQDPDVIMVGEIRDDETARVAINAALTGHLVISTLHTNDAAGVIPRLLDLGANPKTLSSALNISLAQRLVRKLCKECKEKYTPTEKERQVIARFVESARAKQPVKEQTDALWKPGGKKECGACGGIGYKGRIGIFEGILTDSEVERVIVGESPSSREVAKAAEHQNVFIMEEDGVIKALQGITSMEELERVVDLSK